MAPFPKRRSICDSACSMAFSRSDVAEETTVVLRSGIDLSFLFIDSLNCKGMVTRRRPFAPLHSSFFNAAPIPLCKGDVPSPYVARNNELVARCHVICVPGNLFSGRVEKTATGSLQARASMICRTIVPHAYTYV